MSRIVHGLFIAGMPWDGAITPVLFTDGPLDATTISGLSPLSTSTQIVQRLLPAGISGAAARLDLRDPLVSAASPTAMVQDDAEGTLSALFSPDPGWSNTTRWTLLHVTSVAKATTSIVLTGTTAPTVDQIIYLGNEALQVTAVVTSGLDHTCTVTRGVCGSRAVVHSLDPSTYPPGDDGSREALVAYSRRVYDGSKKIECALYQFKMSDTNPHAISSVLWVWYGYLDAVPKQNTEMQWSISVKHFTKALSEHTTRGGEDLELTNCVKIKIFGDASTSYGIGSNGDIPIALPKTVQFIVTPYEFERLFNVPAHTPQGQTTTTTLISNVKTAITSSTKIFYEIKGEVGGHSWVWKVTDMYPAFSFTGDVRTIFVIGSLTDYSPGASCRSDPVVYEPFGDYVQSREEDLNAGFIRNINGFALPDLRVRLEQGETPPKVSLRVRMKPCTFAKAALFLMLSDWGSGSNDATYDMIIGGRGLGFNPSWVNVGSAPASPEAADIGSQEWLVHDAIDNETYEYYIAPGTKIGDWFRNELMLRNMLLSFVPSTGKIAARIWARQASATAVKPVTWPVSEIDSSESLKEQRAIFLERGIDPISLDAKFRKPLQDFEARSVDYSGAPVVRVWKQGGAFQDSELQTGNLAQFLRAVFGVGIGCPRIFAVPLSPDSGVNFGDLITWTDPSIPTASGRGFTAKRMIVVGVDPNFAEFITYAYCLEDLVNLEVTASSDTGAKLGTGLRITGILDIDTTARTATILVDGIDYNQAFAIETGDGGIWASIAAVDGIAVVKNKELHNPIGTSERRGLQEMYVNVLTVQRDGDGRKNYMSISWNAAQDTTRSVDAEDIIKIGSYVELPDYRPNFTSPSGGTYITPIAAQGYNGGSGSNRTHISAVSRRPRFDGRRSLIGS